MEEIRTEAIITDENKTEVTTERVTRIDIRYHRRSRIVMDEDRQNEEPEYTTWDYYERLTLDRDSGTLDFIRQIDAARTVFHRYHVPRHVAALLDKVDIDDFSEIEGNPEDAMDDPMEETEYSIKVYTDQGSIRIAAGSYDKNSLPACWPGFIEEVFNLIAYYGIGELFAEQNYTRPKRRQSDLAFCSVEFEDGGRTYTYIADRDDYSVGDLVVVPVGRQNREKVVRIVSIDYRQRDAAPFPIEKVKHILRKYDGKLEQYENASAGDGQFHVSEDGQFYSPEEDDPFFY